MIKNRRELEAVASQWMERAKNDLRNQFVAFIQENGTNAEELAEALAIDVEEIDQILDGEGDILLSTFAKILIATDNVIEIKPAHVMKHQFGGQMPPRSGMPMHPMTEGSKHRRGQMPPMPKRGAMPFPPFGCTEEMPFPPMGEGMEEMPFPPMGENMPPRFGGMPGMKKKMAKNQPNRLPNGRFAPKNAPTKNVQRVRLEELELDEMGSNELRTIINQNNWANEINLAEAKRGEMIDFLQWKMSLPEAQMEDVHETENERMGRMLAEEVARNPHLKEMVKKYL